ncbi:LktC family protein [Selenomonas artemidis]|uniref:LktC family protein n=1 Tax=Selenomonas artemidis TaxID=671224 RepID=UPI0023F07718|nr:LktC family protein [Selenomonas artemidis]
MTEAAKAFEEYIKKENITGFQIREPGDERQTTVFESELEIEGRRLPILVIIDATAYATVRIRLAQNAVDDTNAMLLTGWLMRQNQDSRLVKFYLTSDTTIIADVVVPHAPEQFDPDVMGSVLRVFVRDITALIPELIQLLPEAE